MTIDRKHAAFWRGFWEGMNPLNWPWIIMQMIEATRKLK